MDLTDRSETLALIREWAGLRVWADTFIPKLKALEEANEIWLQGIVTSPGSCKRRSPCARETKI